MTHTRRVFLSTAAAGTACAVLPRPARASGHATQPTSDNYPSTDPDLARQIVGASHGRLERVEELLAADAGLAKAAWDWGFGDWETALGAASHTGRTDIIEVLLAHGARPDLFTLVTLDRIDAVRSILDASPQLRDLEGPHSISLHSHARAGQAERVLEYFESVGIGPTDLFTTTRERVLPYFGEYAWGNAEADRFVVGWQDRLSCLTLARADGSPRNLMTAGDHAFSPAGARHVVVRFTVEGERATGLVVEGAGAPVRAVSVAG